MLKITTLSQMPDRGISKSWKFKLYCANLTTGHLNVENYNSMSNAQPQDT